MHFLSSASLYRPAYAFTMPQFLLSHDIASPPRCFIVDARVNYHLKFPLHTLYNTIVIFLGFHFLNNSWLSAAFIARRLVPSSPNINGFRQIFISLCYFGFAFGRQYTSFDKLANGDVSFYSPHTMMIAYIILILLLPWQLDYILPMSESSHAMITTLHTISADRAGIGFAAEMQPQASYWQWAHDALFLPAARCSECIIFFTLLCRDITFLYDIILTLLYFCGWHIRINRKSQSSLSFTAPFRFQVLAMQPFVHYFYLLPIRAFYYRPRAFTVGIADWLGALLPWHHF